MYKMYTAVIWSHHLVHIKVHYILIRSHYPVHIKVYYIIMSAFALLVVLLTCQLPQWALIPVTVKAPPAGGIWGAVRDLVYPMILPNWQKTILPFESWLAQSIKAWSCCSNPYRVTIFPTFDQSALLRPPWLWALRVCPMFAHWSSFLSYLSFNFSSRGPFTCGVYLDSLAAREIREALSCSLLQLTPLSVSMLVISHPAIKTSVDLLSWARQSQWEWTGR